MMTLTSPIPRSISPPHQTHPTPATPPPLPTHTPHTHPHTQKHLSVSASRRGPKLRNLQPRTQSFGSESQYRGYTVTWYYPMGDIPYTFKRVHALISIFYVTFIILHPLRNRGRPRLEVCPRLTVCKLLKTGLVWRRLQALMPSQIITLYMQSRLITTRENMV